MQEYDNIHQSNIGNGEETKLIISPTGKVLVVPKSMGTFADVLSSEGNGVQSQDAKADNEYGCYEEEVREGEEDVVHHHNHHHDHNVLIRHVSLELLNPVHECHSRKSSMLVAIVNLIATVCGGGVLSLPLAFKRAGIIPTTIMMIYGLLTTDFSLYILVSCARRTGGRSYGDIAKASFGNFAEVFTTCTLALMLTGSLTAYLVLVRNIWTPVLLAILPEFFTNPLLEPRISAPNMIVSSEAAKSTINNFTDTSFYYQNDGSSTQEEKDASKQGEAIILLGLLIFGSPLLLKHNLHALRHTCYVGFCSCCLLMMAVTFRAYEVISAEPDTANNDNQHSPETRTSAEPVRPPNHTINTINWYSTDTSDLAFAFPIVVLCFLCSYNVLGVHSSLLNPTRERMRIVLDTSMVLCFVLFYMVGLGGYLFAMEDTCDNILMNFSLNDSLILVSRIGYCFTLLFGLPLITLPCREAYRLIPEQIINWRIDAALAKEFYDIDKHRRKGAHLVINGVDFDENEKFLVTDDPEKQHVTMLTYGATHSKEHVIRPPRHVRNNSNDDYSISATENDTDNDEDGSELSHSISGLESERQALDSSRYETFWHCFSTLLIVGFCYFAAISVPGVGFVWSLCGSSMAIMIAFIVPTACYLKIREHKNMNPRSVAAIVLLVISCFAAVLCTYQALQMNS